MMLLFFAMLAFGIILALAGALAGALATGLAKFILWAVERRAASKRARGLS